VPGVKTIDAYKVAENWIQSLSQGKDAGVRLFLYNQLLILYYKVGRGGVEKGEGGMIVVFYLFIYLF
jgi:hypothetical protein